MKELSLFFFFRFFWIEWQSFTLRVGTEEYLRNEIVNYVHNINIVISTISLYKPSDTGSALWEFRDDVGMYTLKL